MPPCNCHPPFPRPEPFSPLPRPGRVPDWGKWIRDRLAEKGALLAFSSASAFPDPGAQPNVYEALDTGILYRWDGTHYQVLVDPSAANDVLEYEDRGRFPETGRAGAVYIDASANLLYRWDGTGYVPLTADLSGVESRLADVESKVPAQATAQNQLADKAFVNSSIATNTAFYISDNGRPFQSLADLENYEGALTNNDYAFVVGRDAAGNTTYTRYKWNEATEAWGEEYVLNNSSFTAEQWAAISSGITSGLVAKLGGIAAGAQVNVIETIKVNGTTLTPQNKAVDIPVPALDDAVTRTSANGVKSSGIWNALWGMATTSFASLYDWCVSQLAGKVPTSRTVNGKPLSSDVTLTGADIAVSGTDATKIDAALAGKASKADATLTPIYSDTPTFSEWTFSPATIVHQGVVRTLYMGINPETGEGFPAFDDAEYSQIHWGESRDLAGTTEQIWHGDTVETASAEDITATRTRTDILGYQLGSQDDKPLASEAEAEALRNGKQNALSQTQLDNIASVPNKANASDLDPLLFAQYYPEGNVKSAAEFTAGIKYDAPDTTHRTITVKPFCNTGTAANDNSNLSGSVVIPPFVDAQGNPYISDDGTRYKVVGVSGVIPGDSNTNLTAVIAPNTVTDIGGNAFALCASLASVSLPAAESIGGWAFVYCGSLTSVDFGGTPRTSVPSLGLNAFYEIPTTCKIIVPYTQYDAWIAASGWSDLQQEFVRHAEKADKPATFTTGNLAALDANGNPTDAGMKASDKLNSTSAASAFSSDSSVSYPVGSHCTYQGKLYKCTTATTGGTWVAASWTADTMTDPDAVLDITAQNQLRVVAKDGTLLWAQGYDLASTSSATLACDATNNFTFADGATTQAFALPTAPTGKVGDFGLDIDNSANASAATMTLTGLDSTFSVVVPEGESLNDMLAIAAGELARFYITLSTFRINNLPTWHILKQVVENGGATV